VGGWRKNYAKATVAQIRGGFINCELVVCESGWLEEKLCEGDGCANKRRIYKYLGYICESGWWLRNYAKLLVAQIRGGFINCELVVCESGWWLRNYAKATVAQIRGGFINIWDIFAKVGGGWRINYAKAPVAQIRGGFINMEW